MASSFLRLQSVIVYVRDQCDSATRRIEAARLAENLKREAEQRAAQELEISRQVQARLFPRSKPRVGALDYAGICIQAPQVGGDYYDFLPLGPDRLGLVIGDIAGKGIAGALLMANLQSKPEEPMREHPERAHRSTALGESAFSTTTPATARMPRSFSVNTVLIRTASSKPCGDIEGWDHKR